jgi:ABC-type transport system involved in multi-copper enzyme maturation permease subunit
MIAALRAEVRKLLTVRSTYGIIIFTLLFNAGLIGFWIFGYKNAGNAGASPLAINQALGLIVNFTSFVLSFIALLSVGHEYRYNTILYALTANNNRGKIVAAKFIVLNLFVLLASAIVIAASIAGFYLGQHLGGFDPLPQSLFADGLLWRIAVGISGTVSLAYIIALLVRSQILSIVVLLIVPMFIEGILTFVLKDNVKYLPFTAITNVFSGAASEHGSAAIIVLAYIIGLGGLAWFLFARRDAN